MFLLVKMFLSAPKAAVADLMRLSTSASEVRELWVIEPRYLNSCVKSIKPATDPLTSRTLKREVSATEYSTHGEGEYIASVLDKTLPLPT